MKYSVYNIDDDGDLKFIYFYKTDVRPQIGETIAYIICDSDGKPSRRVYSKIENILYPVIEEYTNDNNNQPITVVLSCEPVIHVKEIVDEPILNNMG